MGGDVVAKKAAIKTKKVLALKGLGCANCAAKMELQINTLSEVKIATVDFVTKKLTIEVADKAHLKSVIEEATKIVKKFEPDVEVLAQDEEKPMHIDAHSEEESNKKELLRLAIGALLFAAAIIIEGNFVTELTLYLLSYLLVGGEIVLNAFRNILRGQVFDENFLMSVATLGAFAIGEFPEGVAVMLFYQVGELFQDYAVNHSRKSITALMDIRPDSATIKQGNYEVTVSPEQVKVGDIIIVKPGQKVPLDGTVIEGRSMIDTSALTGESVPREVETGDSILGGFINKNGLLSVEVKKEFSESAVSKILDLVENASSRKAPTESFITKFARYYTPVVVFVALGLAVLPPLFVQGAAFSEWVYRALVFLVISCPCALVVSIPLGFFGGIGGASKNGILIKGGNYLEALNNVETVIFDKTGTLTKGVFKVTQINAKQGLAQEQLLEYAAFAESHSNHPIAISIVKAYGKNINHADLENYQEFPGQGIKVNVRGKEILAGNIKLMKNNNVAFDEADRIGTIVHLAIDKVYAGHIIISDEIKEDAKVAIKALKEIGVRKIMMLTGDTRQVGEKVAQELELDEVYTELLPDQKVEKLEMLDKLKSPKGKLVFVGDGINDAPVLARADIGIAMGGLGSDAAIEAADVVIMTDEPSKLAAAIKIAKHTRNIVWQNIIFAIGVKLIVLALGAGGIATMWEAVFADVGVALIAVLNAMRVINVDVAR